MGYRLPQIALFAGFELTCIPVFIIATIQITIKMYSGVIQFNSKMYIDTIQITCIMNIMIHRLVQKSLEEYVNNNDKKIYFLWGPRRSGKTTLLKTIAKELNVPIFNFDLISDRELFVPMQESLIKIASSHKIILIDEVQTHDDSTIALKLLHDLFGVKIIATGSSELRQKSINFDSLAGRYSEHYCLPLSTEEIYSSKKLKDYEKDLALKSMLNNLQVYGAYPEIYTTNNDKDKVLHLQNILDTYVLKDVISIYDLKNVKLAKDILTKLALQIGQEVSLREIANSLQANVTTVSNYVEIFIKNYILVSLPSFKINTRRAVGSNRKIYFMDLGIRNILVRDFRDTHLRPDAGGLFENFIISEIHKKRLNEQAMVSAYFYREYSGVEVDLVLEDYKKNYTAVEIKISENKKPKDVFVLPHKFVVINSNNYYKNINNLF